MTAAFFVMFAQGLQNCDKYTLGARCLSVPVAMSDVTTRGTITSFKNVAVKGSIFEAGAVVANIETRQLGRVYRPNYYNITLSTISTNHSFQSIVSVYYTSLSKDYNTFTELASFWLDSRDSCNTQVMGTSLVGLQVQAVVTNVTKGQHC